MSEQSALRITCTSTDCENPDTPTHCFKPKRGQPGPRGTCRECGADSIDWERVHDRNLADVANTFTALENETFRRHMMHADVPERVRKLALARGVKVLRSRTEKAVRSALSKPRPQNAWDGRQTPRETSDSARIQHYAQHATATCCRQCVEYWHGIPADADLKDEQLRYCVDLAWKYVEQRLGPLRRGGRMTTGRIDTERFSEEMRRRGVDREAQRLRITNFSGSEQERDFTEPANCRGFGRVRHFRRETSKRWPPNPLPIDPAARALRLTLPAMLEAQVFSERDLQLALLVLLRRLRPALRLARALADALRR